MCRAAASAVRAATWPGEPVPSGEPFRRVAGCPRPGCDADHGCVHDAARGGRAGVDIDGEYAAKHVSAGHRSEGSGRTAHAAAMSVLLSPGLLIIDYIHFQYNGAMYGFLLLSLVLARERSTLLASGLVFVMLLCSSGHPRVDIDHLCCAHFKILHIDFPTRSNFDKLLRALFNEPSLGPLNVRRSAELTVRQFYDGTSFPLRPQRQFFVSLNGMIGSVLPDCGNELAVNAYGSCFVPIQPHT